MDKGEVEGALEGAVVRASSKSRALHDDKGEELRRQDSTEVIEAGNLPEERRSKSAARYVSLKVDPVFLCNNYLHHVAMVHFVLNNSTSSTYLLTTCTAAVSALDHVVEWLGISLEAFLWPRLGVLRAARSGFVVPLLVQTLL